MNARSICTAVLLVLGGIACDDDTGSESNASEASPDASVADGGEHSAEHGDGDGDKDTDKSDKDDGSDKTSDDDKTSSEDSDDADAGTAEPATSEPADYSKAANWLCRPGHNERCSGDLDTTVVEADGSTTVETYKPKADPEIDCFYVYPTVSLDETPNSDLKPGPEEDSVVRAQFARFGSQCRLFAPMYRQVTLTALRANLSGEPADPPPDRELGYNDVAAAFKYYLEHDNKGRAFVLVGHSQGSGVLTQLVKQELDKKSLDERFLTAMLIGTNILVPEGKPVGGTFAHVPLCETDDQLGCIVTYASFRETVPPPEDSLFGMSSDDSLVSACTNPANLDGGRAELHSYLNAKGPGVSAKPMGEWAEGVTVDTPFVSVPGLLSAECKSGNSGSYLSIEVNADPDDPRTDDIVGDVITDGEVTAAWGLHLIDVHLAMGDLLDLVSAKAKAYQAK